MSSSTSPIAVVGLALVLPDARTASELHLNLASGRDSVRRVDLERLRLCAADPEEEYAVAALIDDIDAFDFEFFGFSRRETEAMDPQHRFALTLAHAAIEDAGYAVSSVQGARASVILSGIRPGYADLVDEPSALSLIGSAPAAVPGRIAHILGLTGSAYALDAGCSSSLLAVAHACRELREGRCDFSLAGGVSLQTHFEPAHVLAGYPGIMAPDGICRAFDARANGTSDGEGGAILMLKWLEDAQADGDDIRALLRGIGVNHNGQRSNGFVAPSPRAQRDVIVEAWSEAGLDPARIGFLEAHGSGTALGDMIEIGSAQRVFGDAGVGEGSCAVGSVKTNIGHLDHVAGVAGLVKAILSLRYGVLYPSLHFESPNPLIDFEQLYVNTELRPWPRGAVPRTSAVSSFSLTGTNVHVVLEEAAEEQERTEPPPGEAVAIGVSAAAPDILAEYCEAIRAHLDATEWSHHDVAFVLNVGRDDHRHRVAFVADSREAVLDGLAAAAERAASAPGTARQLIVIGSEADASWLREHGIGRFAHVDPAAATALRNGDRDVRAAVAELAGARSHGEDAVLIFGSQVSYASASDVEQALPEAAVHVVSAAGDTDRQAALAWAYEVGVDVDWSRTDSSGRRRIELPTYPFRRTRVWPEVFPPERETQADGAEADVRPSSAAPAPTSSDRRAQLAEIWRRTLKTDHVDERSDFFECGGNSILALLMIDAVDAATGVRLKVPDLYDNASFGALVDLVGSSQAGTAAPIPRIDRDGPLLPTFGQEALWFLHRLEPESHAYNVPVDVPIKGHLDLEALAAAIRDFAERHETLRTVYEDVDGSPRVRLLPPESTSMEIVDLSAIHDRLEREDELRRVVLRIASEPLDLARGPLFRASCIRLAPDEHVLVLVAHHSVDDGWSPPIMHRDLWEFYRARCDNRPANLPPLPIQYFDFAAWEREVLAEGGPRLEEGLAYWVETLESSSPLELVTDLPRPQRASGRGATTRVELSEDVVTGLRRLSEREKVTLFSTMYAAFAATLSLYAGQEDILVGITAVGRDRPETKELIGYFNNAAPLRLSVQKDKTFRELLHEARRVVVDALAHSDIPFASVVAAVRPERDASRHPIFQVGYTHQYILDYDRTIAPGLVQHPDLRPTLEGLPPGTAKWDLDFAVIEFEGQNGFDLFFEYSTDLFEEETIRQLARSLVCVFGEVVGNPDVRIDELTLLAPDEADAIRRQSLGVRREVSEGSIVEGLLTRAETGPDDVAVVDGTRSVSYGELGDDVISGSRSLRDAGVVRGSVVACRLPRGYDALVAFLATQLAGGTYLPLDPADPSRRVERLVAQAGASVVVATEPIGSYPVVRLEGGVREPERLLPRPLDPSEAACLFFTSGSTGTPKGAVVPTAALANFRDHWQHVQGRPYRWATFASPAFDVFVGDILRSVCCGGSLLVVQPEVALSPPDLAQVFREQNVEAAELLPAALRQGLVEELERTGSGLPAFALLVNGSEIWPIGKLRAAAKLLGARIVNTYGLTEAAIDSTWFEGDSSTLADAHHVPIGRAIQNTSAFVLDERLRLLPPLVRGEIYVGGRNLADGYVDDPALTAARFVPNPLETSDTGSRLYRTGDRGVLLRNGGIEFLGRVDDQAKVRGFRVEPGEVESAIKSLAGVGDAVAFVRPDAHAEPTLQAVYTTVRATTEGELRAHLRDLLPNYMIPARLVEVAELPLTMTGKVDRRAAVTRFDGAREPRPERTGAGPEDRLLRIWRGALGRDDIGPDDDFFDAGGHSLLAVRIIAEIEKQFGRRLSLATFFEHRTVSALRAELGAAGPPPGTLAIRLAGVGNGHRVICIHPSGGTVYCYEPIARLVSARFEVYGLQAPEVADPARPISTTALRDLASIYVEELRQLGIAGDAALLGWSLGGVIAFEIALQLEAAGEPPVFVGMLDAEAHPDARDHPQDDAGLLLAVLRANADPEVARAAEEHAYSALSFDDVLALGQRLGVLAHDVAVDELRRHMRLLAAHDASLASYEYGWYDGKIHVFHADGDPSDDRSPDLGWGNHATAVEVVAVPGNHATFLREHAADLADSVLPALAAAFRPRGARAEDFDPVR